jgi:hypothetical protein
VEYETCPDVDRRSKKRDYQPEQGESRGIEIGLLRRCGLRVLQQDHWVEVLRLLGEQVASNDREQYEASERREARDGSEELEEPLRIPRKAGSRSESAGCGARSGRVRTMPPTAHKKCH